MCGYVELLRSLKQQLHFAARRAQLWLASYERGASHVNHVHDGSICSGVYYSSGAPGAAPIVFSDPRGLSPTTTIANDNDDEPRAPFHNQSVTPSASACYLFLPVKGSEG